MDSHRPPGLQCGDTSKMKNKIKFKQINGKRYAVIYIRVSSSDQVEGTSLDDQEARCRKYCEEMGYEVLAVFREEGVSAKSADRKALLELMEYCRKNKGTIDACVVWKVDRFARNAEDHFYVRKILVDYGVLLQSVTEPIGNNPAEKLMEVILAGTAEFDNAIRALRCSNGMKARIAQGIWPFRSPTGYKCSHAKMRGEKKTEPDKPDEKVFPLLQRLLKAYAQEIYGQTDIMNELKRADFEKLCGVKPSLQFTDRLLGKSLAFYAGLLPNPWQSEDGHDRYIKGKHQAMITEEEMLKIRFIKEGGKVRTVRDRSNPEFPLRRLVLCPSCQRFLTGSTSSGRNRSGYSYYHCYNRDCRLKHKAGAKAKIEKDFAELLQNVIPTDEFLNFFSEVVVEHWNSQRGVLVASAKEHEKVVQELEAQRKNIYKFKEDGTYTQEQFKERMAEVDNQVAVAKISLSETRIDQYDIETGIEYAKQAIRDLAKQWLNLAPTLRARFQKLVFPQGIAYDRETGFGTVTLGRIFALNQTYTLTKSPLVDPRGVEPRPVPCHGTVLPLYYGP